MKFEKSIAQKNGLMKTCDMYVQAKQVSGLRTELPASAFFIFLFLSFNKKFHPQESLMLREARI